MTITTDTYRCTRDEASELCAHHIRLAALFFEAAPEEGYAAIAEELARQLRSQDDHVYHAGALFLSSLHKYYEDLKRHG